MSTGTPGGGESPLPGTSSLSGTVRVGGVSRAGALLELSAEGFATREAVSDATGAYVFADVPPGTYVLVVKVAGAVTETRIVTVK